MSEKLLANYEGKLDSTGEIGENCQKQATAADLKAVAHKGAASALLTAAKTIQSQLEALLKKEWDDGDFAKCKTPGAAQDWVLKTIGRASGFCEHLAGIAKNHELIASGEAVALRRMTDIIGKHNDTAASRIRQIQAGEVPCDPKDSKDPKVDGKGNPRRRPGEAPLSVPAMAAVKAKAREAAAAKAKPKKKAGKKIAKKTAKKKGQSRKS